MKDGSIASASLEPATTAQSEKMTGKRRCRVGRQEQNATTHAQPSVFKEIRFTPPAPSPLNPGIFNFGRIPSPLNSGTVSTDEIQYR